MTGEGLIEEIEKERKWLDCAGYNTYNIDVAFATIIKKAKEQEQKKDDIADLLKVIADKPQIIADRM